MSIPGGSFAAPLSTIAPVKKVCNGRWGANSHSLGMGKGRENGELRLMLRASDNGARMEEAPPGMPGTRAAAGAGLLRQGEHLSREGHHPQRTISAGLQWRQC